MDETILNNFHDKGNCPIRSILDRISDKWSLLVLVTLNANGVMRFSEIDRSIGDISQRMLTVTLRTLESDGFISRNAYPEVPPRVEYRLTSMGEGLIPYIGNLVNWAVENQNCILDSRRKYR